MRVDLLRAEPARAADRRAPRVVAVLVAAAAALSACGGGVADSVADAPAATSTAGSPSGGSPTSGAAESGSGESSASGVTIADGVVSFPAELGVPDLTLPDGADAYDTTFNATIGITVDGAEPVEFVESLSAQLTAAGYTVVPLQDGFAQATKDGAADVLLSGGTVSEIAVSPLP